MPITLDGTSGVVAPAIDLTTPLSVSDGGTGVSTGEHMFRNRIINGAMGIWQRGTSGFTSSGNYSADRWLISTGTSLSAVGQSSDVPTGYPYSLSVSGTNVPSARQYIESKNCTDLVGQSVTITVQIKQTSGAGSNAMYIYLAYANSADVFSGLTQIGSTTNLTTTSSWATYTATFTNLPSGAANGLALIIGSNSAGASTFLITGVQLEKGSTATSFDYRPYGTELQLCQRYYYKMYGVGAGGQLTAWGWAASTTNGFCMLQYPVQMRTAPTMETSGTAGDYRVVYGAAGVVVCTAVPVIGTNNQYGARMTVTATGLTSNAGIVLEAQTSNGNLGFNSEL